MSTDLRARYLNQRVLTATPGQRLVMLYDRLVLDLTRAEKDATTSNDNFAFAEHVDHAMRIIAELAGSLRPVDSSPTDNLASIYSYLLGELTSVRGGDTARLGGVINIIKTLREAWAKAVAASMAPTAGARVG